MKTSEALPIARRILRRAEAAAYVGLAPGTMSNLAARGEGPPIVRLGKRAIGYEVRALDAWIELHFAQQPKAT